MYACLHRVHRFNVLLEISVALVPCVLAAMPSNIVIIFKSQGQLALPSNCPNSRPGSKDFYCKDKTGCFDSPCKGEKVNKFQIKNIVQQGYNTY